MRKLTYNTKLISCIIIFFIISILSIYSASKITNSSLGNIFIKQIVSYLIGIIVLLIAYFKKKEINVNPYNKGSSSDLLGNTFLKHNPILNPSPSFGYKYFDREKNISELNENSLQNAGNNLIKGN